MEPTPYLKTLLPYFESTLHEAIPYLNALPNYLKSLPVLIPCRCIAYFNTLLSLVVAELQPILKPDLSIYIAEIHPIFIAGTIPYPKKVPSYSIS